MRKQSVQRTWLLLDNALMTFNSGVQHAEGVLVSDNVGNLSTPSLFLRSLVSVGVVVNSMSTAAVSSNCFMQIGVLAAPTTETGLQGLSVSYEDRRWLYREMRPVLPLNSVRTVTDFSYGMQLDWPIRGGRGYQLQKDEELKLLTSVIGVPAGATVTLSVLQHQLWEIR